MQEKNEYEIQKLFGNYLETKKIIEFFLFVKD